MAWWWIFITLLSCALQARSDPGSFLRKFSATSPDGSWLWGWVWGAESSVSVVDRSPPLTFHARPAAFGREVDEPLLGYVIPLSAFTVPCPATASAHANDTADDIINALNKGCPPLCLIGPHEPDSSETWIALVQRGDCPFVEKASHFAVREAQRLGAKAVVVGGEDPRTSGLPDNPITMYSKSDASDIIIPSTYLRYADYAELNALIKSSTTWHAGIQTLSLLIATQYSAWEWYSPIITFIVILILPSCLTFITLLIHRIRMARAAQRDRAPEDFVKNLPWRVWTGTSWEKHEGVVPAVDPSTSSPNNVDLEAGVAEEEPRPHPSTSRSHEDDVAAPWCENQVECAICLSEFAKGDKVRELPCHHIFHLDEVDAWLINRKKLCPVCKADVTQPWHLTPPKPHSSAEAQPGEDDAAGQPTVTTSPPTERTPLLHAHDRSNADS
ncbi:hypothetical protein CONPUDRAFT_67133 [Coniophora puteana RWD-64-598 SS2]|uniref:RING-type domain-containing protein n=1 Tax=Coniophora puteana (strain RWD-64-598) TaxID=741705 RepID=R7SG54_CONPW|nr:uncharacterized protein CONPUDRAFT_67133 [Coniophora puteana RWD-64-598 SS2]EIW74702.1 hypothetical protein CONPUDRAFT_67133 [Coniophora puteana RWD-64-598 SS2]